VASTLILSGIGCEGEQSGGSRGAKVAIEPEAQEAAESNLLALADLPGGWEAGEPLRFPWDCEAGDYSALTMTGTANGEALVHFAVGEATSRAQVYATEQMAAEALDVLADQLEGDEVERCIVDILVEVPDQRDVQAEIHEIDIHPPAGVDDARLWQAEVTSEEAGIHQYEEMVALRAGERIAFILTSRVPTPLSPAVRDVLIAPVAKALSG
jgi:hypothetical protein